MIKMYVSTSTKIMTFTFREPNLVTLELPNLEPMNQNLNLYKLHAPFNDTYLQLQSDLENGMLFP